MRGGRGVRRVSRGRKAGELLRWPDGVADSKRQPWAHATHAHTCTNSSGMIADEFGGTLKMRFAPCTQRRAGKRAE